MLAIVITILCITECCTYNLSEVCKLKCNCWKEIYIISLKIILKNSFWIKTVEWTIIIFEIIFLLIKYDKVYKL